jgi:glycerol-3-phosphate dehydrogenase (NAD(P)+)
MKTPTYKIAVIGSGSWGTAVSLLFAQKDHEVRLWGAKSRVLRRNEKNAQE